VNDLLDVNVWLALVDKRHVHHPVAARYWSDASVQNRAFCRITANGFLRLSSNAAVMQNPLSLREAWITYLQFLSLPIIRWLPEPPKLDDCFCALTCAPDFAHRLWTDAYLAAFAISSQCRLVSLDGDFKRFVGLDFLHLTAQLP